MAKTKTPKKRVRRKATYLMVRTSDNGSGMSDKFYGVTPDKLLPVLRRAAIEAFPDSVFPYEGVK